MKERNEREKNQKIIMKFGAMPFCCDDCTFQGMCTNVPNISQIPVFVIWVSIVHCVSARLTRDLCYIVRFQSSSGFCVITIFLMPI